MLRAEQKNKYYKWKLSHEIERIVDNFNFNGKISLVVSDNMDNIKRAVISDLKLKQLGCFAHTIHLILQDTLKLLEIEFLLDKVKKSCLTLKVV